MYKYLLILFAGMSMMVLAACSNENSEFGQDLVEGVSIQFEDLDTLDILLSTVKFDSIVTSNLPRVLVGSSEALEDRPGDLVATTFFTVGHPSPGTIDLGENDLTYDSIALRVTFEGYYSGDSSQMVTYKLAQLENALSYEEDSTSFYNFSKQAFDRTNTLGELEVRPRPLRKESFEIRLADDFGGTIFELLKTNDESIETSENLRDYLRGFALFGEQSNDFIAGFLPEMKMLIYYTESRGELTEQKAIEFDTRNNLQDLLQRDVAFSSYETDFSPSKIDTLETMEDAVSSSETDKVAYVSAGRGLAVRVDIPSLYNFAEQLDNEFINSTILTIRPDFLMESDPSKYMERINVFKVDEDNEIIGFYEGAATTLRLDKEFNTETFYEVNVSSFINEQLNDAVDNRNGLLILLENQPFNTTMESFIIGDNKNKNLKSKLNINIIKRQDE